MAVFELKSDLPIKTQNKIDYIEAIASAQRTANQTAFLTSLTPYLTNLVISIGDDGLITSASGLTVPTGYEGFRKGATFIKTDATANGLYVNIGSSTVASWDLVDEASTTNIANGSVTSAKLASSLDFANITVTNLKLEENTPVNGVAASKVLTVAGVPSEGETVTLGTDVYKFRAAIGVGAVASLALDFSDVPLNTETVTMDTDVFTFVTALTEAKATSTLTLTGNPTNGNSVTIGSTVYTFKETLASAYDVLIGAAATNTIDNLIAAINLAAGEGSTYGTGTLVHPTVVAAVGAGDTMGITAKTIGVAGNAIATTELGTVAAWTSTVMAGGVDAVANQVVIGTVEGSVNNLVAAAMGTAGEGTTYSTDTVALTTVSLAKTDADTVTLSALEVGFAGNSIAVAETLTNAAWTGGAVALAGGVDAEAANDVLIGGSAELSIDNLVLAITAGAGEGTNYGTGTVANTVATAVKTNASTMTATALATGTGGNAIAIAETGADLSWAGAATALSGGVSQIAGEDFQIVADATNLYIFDGTVWKKLVLQTL